MIPKKGNDTPVPESDSKATSQNGDISEEDTPDELWTLQFLPQMFVPHVFHIH